MKHRTRVKKMTVCLSYPGGIFETRTIEGKNAEAVIISSEGVTEILAPYYNNVEKYMDTEELVDVFGSDVRRIIGEGEKVRLTSRLINELWNFKNSKGVLPPMIVKKTDGSLEFLKLHPWVLVFKGHANPRPQIGKVILHLLDHEGFTINSVIQGTDLEGIFWSDGAVDGMLSPLYEDYHPEFQTGKLLQVFGDSAAELGKDGDGVLMNRELIERMWNMEDSSGTLPASIIKTVDTMPGILDSDFDIPEETDVLTHVA